MYPGSHLCSFSFSLSTTISIAAFFDPDKDEICQVNEKFLSDGEEPKYEPISSIDYLTMKIKEAQKS